MAIFPAVNRCASHIFLELRVAHASNTLAVAGALYEFFSFTFASLGVTAKEIVFQLIACPIQAAIARAIYNGRPASVA